MKVTGELDGFVTLTKSSKATAKVAAGTLKVTKLAIHGAREVGARPSVARALDTRRE